MKMLNETVVKILLLMKNCNLKLNGYLNKLSVILEVLSRLKSKCNLGIRFVDKGRVHPHRMVMVLQPESL